MIRKKTLTFMVASFLQAPFGPVTAEQMHLKDFIAQSEYLRVEIPKRSNYISGMQEGFRRSPENFKLWGSIHQSCPTWTWWSNDYGSQKDVQKKLQEAIGKELKGFPEKSIKKCKEVATIFADLKPSKHWRNEKMFFTNDVAIALKDIKNGNISIHRGLTSSNLSVEGVKKEAILYNESLDAICSFKKIDLANKIAEADCGVLGKGKALVGNEKSKNMTFSVNTSKVAFFAVMNMTTDAAKKKFPEIFK